MDDEYEWQPPSEAEMKIIQARRERSDKISKLMGDYMLKGYKMLGIVCPECSTILLQDKQGVNYCVACKELDTDTDKDDPVLSRDAARSQILEGSVTEAGDTDLPFMLRQDQPTSVPSLPEVQQRAIPITMAAVTSSGISSQSAQSSLNLNFNDTVETLCQKINWASEELKKSSSVDYCVNLCQLIKSSADALQSLKKVG
ncbi:protein ZNRD2-like [Mercenaria mercenaria]|uniref:protein ZNRD2-like n=1 Tax=Mercenaria mercenaria TaxID=6596 RepID=UPI00234E9697|nr:protein ZNRD2-like [Mercenaria mercenaria]